MLIVAAWISVVLVLIPTFWLFLTETFARPTKGHSIDEANGASIIVFASRELELSPSYPQAA